MPEFVRIGASFAFLLLFVVIPIVAGIQTIIGVRMPESVRIGASFAFLLLFVVIPIVAGIQTIIGVRRTNARLKYEREQAEAEATIARYEAMLREKEAGDAVRSD